MSEKTFLDGNSNPTAVKKVIDGAIGLGKGAGSLAHMLIRGNTWYQLTQGKNYKIMFDTSKSCVVNVLDTTLPKSLYVRGEPWIFRFDRAHGKTNYPHLNLNRKIFGKDLHLKLPPGGLEVAKAAAKAWQASNTVSDIYTYTIIAVDLGKSVVEDYSNGTITNTLETAAKVGSGIAGAKVRGMTGAAIGSAILPGPGSMVLGYIGATFGMLVADYLSKLLGDQYDITREECNCGCGTFYTVYTYKGEAVEKLYKTLNLGKISELCGVWEIPSRSGIAKWVNKNITIKSKL